MGNCCTPDNGIRFDGCDGLVFNQGEDKQVDITVYDPQTNLPINLTGGVVALNLPRQGGGSVKRTSGVVGVPFAAVNISPASSISLPDHGLVTGDPIQVAAQGGGSLPGGLVALTNYLIKTIDNDTFQITDTSGNIISLTSQGTVGFDISNTNPDLALVSGDLGQVTLKLRALVSAAVNAALAQNFQFEYVISSATRIIVVENLLDVIAQPTP